MQYKIKDLVNDLQTKNFKSIAKAEGVYKVLNIDNITLNCNNATLMNKYKNSGYQKVLYIGKAKILSRRIKQYIKQGLGLGNNHRGGIDLFEIVNWQDLYLETNQCCDSLKVERGLINNFKNSHNGILPFANRR